MAIRVRSDGRMFCAALRRAMPGDTYIDDTLHYAMSVVYRVIVCEAATEHRKSAEWWWRGMVPTNTVIDDYYKDLKSDHPQQNKEL